MQPMVMNYEVSDPSALSSLKRGDEIHATLLSDGAQQWVLQDVKVASKH
jgi:Cu/Ag efflux protein CusF